MPQYIIGRKGNQPFKIPPTATGVSGEHAKLLIENGCWTIEDLNSTNGIFLRDDKGDFNRIFKMQLSEDAVVRLGSGGYHSYTFMLHRVLAPAGDFSYEFMKIQEIAQQLISLEAKQESIASRNNWIARCSGIGAVLLCSVAGSLFHINIDLGIRYMLIASAPVLVGILFQGDTTKIKEIRGRRRKLLVCPNCGRPLSDYEIEQRQCSNCKAK